MGDGRYYTYSQFFNIFFGMGSICYLLIITSNLYFRNRKNNQLKYILFILCTFIILALSRFLEEVIFDNGSGYILKTIESICFVWIIGLSIIYFSLPDKAWKRIAFIYIIAVISVVLFFNNWIPVKVYTLQNASYNQLFVLMISIGLVFSALAKFFNNNNYSYKNEEKTIHLLWVAIMFPVIGFIFNSLILNQYDFYSYLIPITTFFIYRLCYYELPSQVITQVYDKLEKSLDEVIIVTNMQGKVVYHNLKNHPVKSLISLPHYIDYQSIGAIFISKDISISQLDDGKTIIIKDLMRCFFAMYAPLYKNKRLMGYLYLLQDTTDLQNMIEKLRLKNEEYKTKNQELQDYSDLVYRYEFEKEINLLTNEINSKLGHQMIELSLFLQKAYNQMDDLSCDVIKNLQDSIYLAKNNLQDVRAAVTQYKRYFEE